MNYLPLLSNSNTNNLLIAKVEECIFSSGLTALLKHSECLSTDTGVSMLVCFDHEEIGSASAQGNIALITRHVHCTIVDSSSLIFNKNVVFFK